MMRPLHQKNLSPGRARGDLSPPYASTAGLTFLGCRHRLMSLQIPTKLRGIFKEKKFNLFNHSKNLYLASQIESRRSLTSLL
jgi:hypothetical protein